MVRKVDHIGVAVSNLEEALKIYTDVLGSSCTALRSWRSRRASGVHARGRHRD